MRTRLLRMHYESYAVNALARSNHDATETECRINTREIFFVESVLDVSGDLIFFSNHASAKIPDSVTCKRPLTLNQLFLTGRAELCV